MATEEDEAASSNVPMISLFKQRRIKGWWPFTAKNDQDELEITVRYILTIQAVCVPLGVLL